MLKETIARLPLFLTQYKEAPIFLDYIKENTKAVLPIVFLVFILNFFVGLASDLLIKFVLGAFGVIVGLSVFLSGIDLSISKIGSMMGDFLGRFDKIIKVILFGIFIGFVISMAEPDLLILANQITQAI